jgi:hypothetical protein
MQDLTDLIKKHTPKNINSRFRGKTFKCWGYEYPPRNLFYESTNPNLCREVYSVFCIRALGKMEEIVKQIFGEERIIINERDKSDQKIDAEEIRLQERIISVASRILGIDPKASKEGIGLFDSDEPEQQRLIVFDYGPRKKISFSVSHKRHLDQFYKGAHILWPEEGFTSFKPRIPVIVNFKGFNEKDEEYIRLNQILSQTVFGDMWRKFPLIENTPPSELSQAYENHNQNY